MITHEDNIQALHDSIEHWKKNARLEKYDTTACDADKCALCDLHYELSGCASCPIGIHTGQTTCIGTPYHTAVAALDAWEEALKSSTLDEKTAREQFISAAQQEVRFLNKLLEVELLHVGIQRQDKEL